MFPSRHRLYVRANCTWTRVFNSMHSVIWVVCLGTFTKSSFNREITYLVSFLHWGQHFCRGESIGNEHLNCVCVKRIHRIERVDTTVSHMTCILEVSGLNLCYRTGSDFAGFKIIKRRIPTIWWYLSREPRICWTDLWILLTIVKITAWWQPLK